LVTEGFLVAAAYWCYGGYTSLKGSVGPIVREVKKYYIKSRRIRMPYMPPPPKKRKDNWIGHILCRNWLLKHIIKGKVEGKIETTGRVGRRRKQLFVDLEETV